MKIKLLRFFNFVIFAILSCFGISSTKQVMAMYGVPSGEFQLSGRVENLKSKPVRKIEVEVQDNQQRILGVTSTEKDGSFNSIIRVGLIKRFILFLEIKTVGVMVHIGLIRLL
jgi:putative lipoprotein (rSAM/lipoprotein system)